MSLHPDGGIAPLRVDAIDALLPQTQCQRCGYPDCRRYAEALVSGAADIDRCPPGGEEGIRRLAQALNRAVIPLHPEVGPALPAAVAVIDENWCIGCTLCLKVCPTDAIVGSHKRMHTVIESACTGCDLCLPVCPVDCIQMEVAQPALTGWDGWRADQAEQARQRYQQRQQRLPRQAAEHQSRKTAEAEAKLHDLAAHSRHTDPEVLARKKAIIEAAMARARATRAR